jgi:2-C-methyl-D-erythritol 4-phosphate cytidylyltransferase
MINHAIIVAGGTGSRMRGDMPKQFMLLGGKPVIQYSIDAFHAFDPDCQIIIVIHPDYMAYWEQLCREFSITTVHTAVGGGENRFDSVKNGLAHIEGDGLVAVHDAARPVISAGFVEKQFSEAAIHGTAIPGTALNDTIRIIEGDGSRQLDRSFLRAMQTPQVFRVSELKRAYAQPFKASFTDDASVMQSAGFALHITEGRAENIKITNPQDIAIVAVLMKML